MDTINIHRFITFSLPLMVNHFFDCKICCEKYVVSLLLIKRERTVFDIRILKIKDQKKDINSIIQVV